MLVFLNIAYSIEGGGGVDIVSILIQTLTMTLSIIITFIVSFYIGKLFAKLVEKISNPIIVSALAIILTLILFLGSGPIGASFGIIIGFGIGMGYNVAAKPETKISTLGISQKIYGFGLLPIVFIYVGTQIQIDQLFRPITVIAFAIVTCLSIFTKGFLAHKTLGKFGSSKAEQDYASYGFAAKGIILINISLVIGTGLTSNGLDYILQMMYMLAAISIIISIPYSSIKLGKQLDVLEDENK